MRNPVPHFCFKFNENCSFFQLFQKKIKILPDCAQISFGGTYCHILFLFVLPCAWVPCAYVFFLNITKHRHAFLAIWLVENFVPPSCPASSWLQLSRSGRLLRPITCVLGVLEGWMFLCMVTPSWGADNQNFKKKSTKKKLFCLISPTHNPARNSCSKGARGLKFVMRIDPPPAEATITFLFQNATKIFIFSTFSKK